MVPDVVEELEVSEDGKSVDTQWLRMIVSESDEHALEQALILKEKYGGRVTVLAPGGPDVDEVLYTALAKGADRAVKIAGEGPLRKATTLARRMRKAFQEFSGQPSPEMLILMGSQAIDDLEGEPAAYFSEMMGLPYVSVVTGVELVTAGQVQVIKEFRGGWRGVFTMGLPAVIGIQSSEKPPRYVPVAKVRSVMKSAKIESITISLEESDETTYVERMYKRIQTGQAKMLEGSPEEVAVQIADILAEKGIL